MSVATSARCLLSRRFAAAVKPYAAASIPQYYSASFHTSARLEKRRKSRFANVNAQDMGLVDGPARGKTYDAAIENYAKEQFQPYTPEELEVLKKHYTTGQMEALEAGEAAIDPKDLSVQGRLRRDSYKLPYLDDFSRIVPTIDRQPTKSTYTNSNSRWLSTEEYLAKLTEGSQAHLKPLLARTNYTEKEWEAKSPEEKKHITQEVQKSLREHQELDSLPALARDEHVWSRTSILNVGGSSSNPAVAPALGTNIPDVSGVYTSPIDPEDSGLDDDGKYQDLKRRTGMSVRDMTALTCKVLVARFVHNQTRLGKIRSVAIMAIAGNGNGRLGIGEAKSTEAAVAIQKAKLLAIGNMQPIRRYEDRTIHGDIDSKFGATIVKLQARPPGFGLRVPARLFEMCRACGIKDIAGSMPRSRNPMNSVKATFHALTNQRDPNEIAIGRGKKLVDVRNVYFGGNVL